MVEDTKNSVVDRQELHPYEDEDSVAFSAAHLHAEEVEYPFEDVRVKDDPFLRAQRRVPIRKGAVNKRTADRLRNSFIATAILLVVAGIAFGLHSYVTKSWRFRIDSSDNIESTGLHNVSRAQVLDVLGADIGRNIFSIPLEEQKRKLEEIPWVESATIMRLLPSRLRINIHERIPIAFARVGTKIMFIDTNGVLMEMPPHISNNSYSFPVLTGMDESEPLSTRAPRMKIYEQLVKSLDAGDADYSKRVSEVDISDPNDVKVVVDAATSAVLVHLGNSEYQERFRIYVTHISEWRAQFSKLDSVDLRYNGQIIINPESKQGQTAEVAAQTTTVNPAPARARKQ
jgi:cell division protein FtsQ